MEIESQDCYFIEGQEVGDQQLESARPGSRTHALNHHCILIKTTQCVHSCKVKQQLQIIQVANPLLLQSIYHKGNYDIDKFIRTNVSILHLCLNTALETLHFWEIVFSSLCLNDTQPSEKAWYISGRNKNTTTHDWHLPEAHLDED